MNRHKMTLDEAIENAEEKAEEIRNEAEHYEIAGVNIYGCEERAQEWEQFAEWLKELKRLREQTRWIPASEMLPEEREWVGTKRFGTTKSDEVYVTFECPDGNRFTEHLAFQNGRIPPYKQREMEVFFKGAVPIAWKPLPEPYKVESEGEE